MRTKYEPGKDNAAKTKANTQLAIANRIIQQTKQAKEVTLKMILSKH